MNVKRIFKRTTLAVALLALGLIGGTSLNSEVHIAPQANVSASVRASNPYRRYDMKSFAQQRSIYHFPHIAYNFRDLGGLPTADHRYQIKPGHIFRSNNLSGITPHGVQEIHGLYVKRDIDLRYPTGSNRSISTKPAPGELGFRRDDVGLHMHFVDHPVQTNQEERTRTDKRMFKKYGEVYDFMNVYTLPKQARRSYHQDLMTIMHDYHNHDYSVMYNCTQGRDRTGILSAIFEHILGVSDRTIYQDFLLTNVYYHQNSYYQQFDRINSFYNSIYKHYGSFNNYVRKGLDIHPWVVKRLRHEYLQPITAKTRANAREVRRVLRKISYIEQ